MPKSSFTLINFILLIATICAPLEYAHGAPVVHQVRNSSTVRRAQINGPTEVHTTHTTQTTLGPVTESCDILLTPFKAPDGTDLVREDRKCVIEFDPNGSSQSSNPSDTSNGGDNNGGLSNSNTDGSTSPDSSGSTSDGSNTSASTNTGQDGATIIGSGAIGASALSSIAASSTAGSSTTSSVEISATPAPQSAGSVSQNTDSGAAAGDNTPTPTSTPGTTPSGSSSSTGTSAAADSTSTNFQLPGTKLSVLPIGLGVFAGVSVIALIVVGLVTYERTKYRKAFRQRKLAEQGQAPGMSERPM